MGMVVAQASSRSPAHTSIASSCIPRRCSFRTGGWHPSTPDVWSVSSSFRSCHTQPLYEAGAVPARVISLAPGYGRRVYAAGRRSTAHAKGPGGPAREGLRRPDKGVMAISILAYHCLPVEPMMHKTARGICEFTPPLSEPAIARGWTDHACGA